MQFGKMRSRKHRLEQPELKLWYLMFTAPEPLPSSTHAGVKGSVLKELKLAPRLLLLFFFSLFLYPSVHRTMPSPASSALPTVTDRPLNDLLSPTVSSISFYLEASYLC
jgi:hypothetical protein